MDPVGDRMRLEQVPQLGQFLQCPLRALAAEAAGGRVENLAAATKRREREQEAALRIRRIRPLERRLDSDEISPGQSCEDLLPSRRVQPRRIEQPGDEIRVPDIHLYVLHTATLEGGRSERDAFRVGREAVRPDELAPRSEEHTSELQSPCNLVCR